MEKKEQNKLLCDVLGSVSAQLRGAVGNLCAAMQLAGGSERRDPIVQQSLYRMMRMLNNLSDAPILAEDVPFRLCNQDLPVWLTELYRQALPLAQELGVTLTLRCSEEHHLCAVHLEYLGRLVWNLLSNALKFTPAGGEIVLGLEFKSGQALLSVADNGCGISDEQMAMVYERYLHPERQEPPKHGLGLGLPLCRRIAEGHGGRLLLASRQSEGTTATAALPDHCVDSGVLHQPTPAYAGGFQPVMVELSDALPYTAFTERNLDE